MNEIAEQEVVKQEVVGIERLSRDLREASAKLGEHEARFLVDQYYLAQTDRIRTGHQQRTMDEAGEPTVLLGYLFEQFWILESQIKYALDRYSKAHPLGSWPRAVTGIGPVICAGLLAHLDIEKASTAGKFYAFAGLAPDVKWEKGEKRPWNTKLKTLCWKAGESFIKNKGREKDFYGKFYDSKKAEYEAKNLSGGYTERAEEILEEKKWRKDTESYKAYIQGLFPKGHIHAMARRYAVKLFLSHLHEIWYFQTYKILPPAPFPIGQMDHADYIAVPYQEAIPGWDEYQALQDGKVR